MSLLDGPQVTREDPGPAMMRRFYGSIDAGDLAALVGAFATDAVYHRPGFEPLVGRDEIERFYRERRTISTGRHTLAAVVSSGEHIAVHGDFRGTLRDGRTAAHRFAKFFTVTPAGLVARRDTFFFVPLV